MKRFITIMLALLLAFAIAGPVKAEQQDMWAYAYSWDGKINTDGTPVLTRLSTGVRFWVCAIDTSTLETLTEYNDNANTSLTNPVTSTNFASNTVCNDMVAFRVDPTDATSDRYVDVYVVDVNGGYFAFVENFDKYTHTIVIDERPGVIHHGVYRSAVITATTEIDTELEFDYDTMVHNVWVEVVTTAADTLVDVGIDTSAAGDEDGFVNGSSMATAGYPTQSATTKGDFIDDGTSDSMAYAIDGTEEQTMCYAGDSITNATGVVNIHYMFSVIPAH